MPSVNPFAVAGASLPVDFLQVFLVVMVLAVVAGTLFDIVHKGSARYFFANMRKAKDKGRPLGGGELVSIAVQTAVVDVLASGEFCNHKRRVAHLLGMYGFVLYVVATAVMVFRYPTTATPPAIWPLLWWIGALMVLVAASGIFGEMQAALNTTWEVKATDEPLPSLIRARAASLGLVAALGFVTMVSLVASTALSALSRELEMRTPVASFVLTVLNTSLSLVVFAVLFAAIYKMLPDKPLRWRDVASGAAITAGLFTGGKSLIGWYLGQAAPGSAYGAAGAIIVLLLWAYYSAQIFLFGAELTKAIGEARGRDSAQGPALLTERPRPPPR